MQITGQFHIRAVDCTDESLSESIINYVIELFEFLR